VAEGELVVRAVRRLPQPDHDTVADDLAQRLQLVQPAVGGSGGEGDGVALDPVDGLVDRRRGSW
jgi:hypothetical protein